MVIVIIMIMMIMIMIMIIMIMIIVIIIIIMEIIKIIMETIIFHQVLWELMLQTNILIIMEMGVATMEGQNKL